MFGGEQCLIRPVIAVASTTKLPKIVAGRFLRQLSLSTSRKESEIAIVAIASFLHKSRFAVIIGIYTSGRMQTAVTYKPVAALRHDKGRTRLKNR